jgi:hypothetical protein
MNATQTLFGTTANGNVIVKNNHIVEKMLFSQNSGLTKRNERIVYTSISFSMLINRIKQQHPEGLSYMDYNQVFKKENVIYYNHIAKYLIQKGILIKNDNYVDNPIYQINKNFEVDDNFLYNNIKNIRQFVLANKEKSRKLKTFSKKITKYERDRSNDTTLHVTKELSNIVKSFAISNNIPKRDAAMILVNAGIEAINNPKQETIYGIDRMTEKDIVTYLREERGFEVTAKKVVTTTIEL